MPDETTPTAEQADLEATDVSERLSPEDHREEEPQPDDTSPDTAAQEAAAATDEARGVRQTRCFLRKMPGIWVLQ